MNTLDNPVFHGLSTRQSPLAQGNSLALRFDPTISIFAAPRDLEQASLKALGDIVPPVGGVVLLQRDEVATPEGCNGENLGIGYQFILANPAKLLAETECVELHEGNFAEMLDLATLTRPGPFLLNTPRIGGYIGIRRAGKLAAMAGERFRPEGFAEISAVCTHPDFRGQGLGGTLSSIVAHRILARGEQPFLHAFSQNRSAIALYEKLGFEKRCDVFVKRVTRAS